MDIATVFGKPVEEIFKFIPDEEEQNSIFVRGHFLLRKKPGFSGFRLSAALFAAVVSTSSTTAANNGFAALTIPCPEKKSYNPLSRKKV